MKRSDLVQVMGVALLTAGLALAFLWPSFVDAEGDAGAKAERPTLKIGGVELSLSAPRPYVEGETAEFVLTGVNKTSESVTVSVEMLMKALPGPVMTMPDGSLRSMSRTLPMPRELFRQTHSLTFAPLETKTATVKTTALPSKSLVQVFLNTTGDTATSAQVQALAFATNASNDPATLRLN